MQGESTDEELMLAFGAGDAGAFETLYSRHRLRLFRHLQRQVRDASLAEELFQDVWQRVIAARERYRPEAKFSTWLHQFAEQLDNHTQQQEHWNVADPAVTSQRTVGFSLVRHTAPWLSGGLHWSVDALPAVDPGFELALQVSVDEHDRVLSLSVQSPTAQYAEADLRINRPFRMQLFKHRGMLKLRQ